MCEFTANLADSDRKEHYKVQITVEQSLELAICTFIKPGVLLITVRQFFINKLKLQESFDCTSIQRQ